MPQQLWVRHGCQERWMPSGEAERYLSQELERCTQPQEFECCMALSPGHLTAETVRIAVVLRPDRHMEVHWAQ